jgi:prepilin-type N-terminal cleavage/methylation domain-containing protein/prepilin-type processing-associated H-X9-DG protein
MKTNRKLQLAFTLLEMLMVITIIGILAARLLPALARAKPKAQRVQCLNNLKQTGIAFHLFANDHQHLFPMQVSVRDGGSMEWVPGGNAFRHLAAVSNDVSVPRIFVCPSDPAKVAAPDWGTFKNTNLSYFVGVDAKPNYPNSLLAGDRNISQDSIVRSNILQTNFSATVGWTTNIHNDRGNILFSGGHVLLLDTPGLRAAFNSALEK